MKRAVAGAQTHAADTQVFRTADVARILRTTPARVRTIARAGLSRPLRRGRALHFGFQDLVLLRAAHGLLQADVPARRVRRALTELARQLPPERPLSGVRIYADGRQVVARDGRAAWQPDSGQVVFSFEVEDLARQAGVVVSAQRRRRRTVPGKPPPEQEAPIWFERALALEQEDAAAAQTAYRKALDLDPEMGDAYINLGRLMHEAGDVAEAARLYHLALECMPADPIAHYNLALALEDQRHTSAALAHYRRALELDATFADAHFNLGRLLERLGRRTQAMPHLMAYKKLTDGKCAALCVRTRQPPEGMPMPNRPKATKPPPSRKRVPAKASAATQHGQPILNRTDVRQIVHDLATRLAPADVTELMAHEDELRASRLQLDATQFPRLRAQLAVALDCLRDHLSGACPQIPYYTVSLLAAGVCYFEDELDVIPDFLPRIGRLDDAAVMAMAFELGRDGVQRYCDWRGLSAETVLVRNPTPTGTRERGRP